MWLGWFVELQSRCVPVGCSRVVNLDVSGVFEREREEKGINRCDLGVECKQWFYNYRILNSKKDKKSAHETPELRQLHRENRRLIVGKKKENEIYLRCRFKLRLEGRSLTEVLSI